MSTPLNLSHSHWTGLRHHRRRHHHHHHHHHRLFPPPPPHPPSPHPKPLLSLLSTNPHPFPLTLKTPNLQRPLPNPPSAGRSKKKPGGPSPGRIEGNADVRRLAKQNARRRGRRLAENLFFHRNRLSSSNQADSFTDDELRAVGLGYDRYVRFMSKDDPNLRHPHDWYKYGRYGPYNWRGIVIGPPIRGRFSDDRVTLIEEVLTDEEWEKIEQFEMSCDFSPRLQSLNASIGFRYYWIFVRHPKWRPTDLPWQQWTLVSEIALEAGKEQRLDKWSLMARLGNKTRAMVTQCAAWMRPDIIYVKRPVYQCRFEPQYDFFKLLMPLVDPITENEYQFELTTEEGRVETCTYFGGLCRIVKISPKSYVDDVTNAYEKLSDEGKSRCLEFLLTNHPMELLHPYTKEWKAKLEERELGCDAPDGSDDENGGDLDETRITEWIEDDGNDDDDEEEEDDEVIDVGGNEEVEEEDDEVIDVGGNEDDEVIDVGGNEDDEEMKKDPEESEEYWNEQWKKAVRSSTEMEKLVTKSVEVSTKFYKKQMMEEEKTKGRSMDESSRVVDESSRVVDENWQKESEDWESKSFKGPKRRVKKSKIPPELFLRAAVRPFTYRNLVKEIVLMRHAFVDGDMKRG